MNERKKSQWAVKVSMLLLLTMITSLFPLTKPVYAATARTQEEAVNWAVNQIGKGLDYDGVYGNQCVDLIKYYYDFFGVADYARGNANAYANNELPSGWQRVSDNFQPGDIAVWKTSHRCGTCNTSSLGHVGIITSADSTGFNAVNQNFNNTPRCTHNWFRCSALQCAIRPAFSSGQAGLDFVRQRKNFVDRTNAEVYVRIMNQRRHLTRVGCELYDADGTLLKTYHENCDYRTSYVNYTCNMNVDMGYRLKPNKKYKYVLYAVVDGETYKDKMRSFKTTS